MATSRYSQICKYVDILIAQCSGDDFYLKFKSCPAPLKDLVILHAIKLFQANVDMELALRRHDFGAVKNILDKALELNESNLPGVLVYEMRKELDKIFNEKGDKLEELRKTCLRLCILINKS